MKAIVFSLITVLVVLAILAFAGYYFIGSAAIVQPSTGVNPGDNVQFDTNLYMNCGLCDLARYPNSIDGYIIKVYNQAGNLVKEEWFLNPIGMPWELKCGRWTNIAYNYKVPADAQAGTWRIKVEVVTHSLMPLNPDCIVAIDEGSFTVSDICTDKEQSLNYCINEITLVNKPVGTCARTYTVCNAIYGQGYKCVNGACQKVEVCGDGICDELENPYNCYSDCGWCGDNLCTGSETPQSCPQDCYSCGDGVCRDTEIDSCPLDCAVCGDGKCRWYEETPATPYYCEKDCGCADCGSCYTRCDDTYPVDMFNLGNIFKNPQCKLDCWWKSIIAYMYVLLISFILSAIIMSIVRFYPMPGPLNTVRNVIMNPVVMIVAIILLAMLLASILSIPVAVATASLIGVG